MTTKVLAGGIVMLALMTGCSAPDAQEASSSAAASQEVSKPAQATKPDTAGSVVERMECDDKTLTKADLDADALTPAWAEAAKSVAACQQGVTQAVVAEFATKDEALQAVAQAQKSDGWRNRVTIDGRFARGASGNEWASVKFPDIAQ